MRIFNLSENKVEFNKKAKPNNKEGKAKKKKRNSSDSESALYECRELTSNGFKSGIFPIEATKGEGLKILAPKQMLQRLPIPLAQVKADIFCNEQKKITKKYITT